MLNYQRVMEYGYCLVPNWNIWTQHNPTMWLLIQVLVISGICEPKVGLVTTFSIFNHVYFSHPMLAEVCRKSKHWLYWPSNFWYPLRAIWLDSVEISSTYVFPHHGTRSLCQHLRLTQQWLFINDAQFWQKLNLMAPPDSCPQGTCSQHSGSARTPGT